MNMALRSVKINRTEDITETADQRDLCEENNCLLSPALWADYVSITGPLHALLFPDKSSL